MPVQKKSLILPAVLTAGGLALLLTGGTYALWSDSVDITEQRVTPGLLDVGVVGVSAHDVSPDRAATVIEDLESWKAVPGDVVEFRSALDVGLKGQNLVAALDISGLTTELNDAGLDEVVDITTELRDADDKVLTPGSEGYRLQSAGTAGQEGAITVGEQLEGQTDVVAVAVVKFSGAVGSQELTSSELARLGGDEAISLTQVRDAGQ